MPHSFLLADQVQRIDFSESNLLLLGGFAVLITFALLGLGVAWFAARRARTCPLCANSLITILAALGAAGVACLLPRILAPENLGMQATVDAITRLVVLLGSMASLLMAVVGMLTYQKTQFEHGRPQALSGGMLAVLTAQVCALTLFNSLAETDAAKDAVPNVARVESGYTTRIKDPTWKKWDQGALPLADFSTQRTNEAMLVLPLDLKEPHPPIEVCAAGLLGRLDIAFPTEDKQWHSKAWTSAWGEGLEITGKRKVDSQEYEYVLRVAAHGPKIILVAAWAATEIGNMEKVRAVIDQVELNLPPDSSSRTATLSQPQREDLALLMNDIGLALYNRKDFGAAAHWFGRANELKPANEVYVSNAADAYYTGKLYKEGLRFIDSRHDVFQLSSSTHLFHAKMLAEEGQLKAACDAYTKAIDSGLDNEDSVLDWLKLMNDRGQPAMAESVAAAWAKKRKDVNARRWHAQVVGLAGNEKRAVELLQKLADEHPDDQRVTYDLAEALNDAGEHVRASELATALLAEAKSPYRALMILGWSQMGRKWAKEAKETFEKAAAAEPESETAKDAVRRASAMLGQGNNSDIKTPVQPVSIPEILLQACKEHKVDEKLFEGQPFMMLVSAIGYHFKPHTPSRKTWFRRVRILNTEGVNYFSSVDFAFNPLYERIFINRVRVTDETGKTLTSAPGDAYVMDLDDGSATHRQKLHFQIPSLRPGCELEYEVSIESRGAADTFDFTTEYFSNSAADVVFVTGAVDQIQTRLSMAEKITVIKDMDMQAWLGFNLPRDPEEPVSVLFEDRVPTLWMCSPESSWKEAGNSMLKEIADRLEISDSIKALATKLTEGLKTPEEKVAALSQHVQREISYTAIEFGVRARRPNPPDQTLRQQYGDCKDQALLLHQLLTSAGVESYLALVHSQNRVHPELPSLDQFNHMVVHVPALGKGWLADTTNRWLAADRWPADDLWDSHALVLKQGGSELLGPPAPPKSEASRVESRRFVTPTADGWLVKETLTLHGYYSVGMRGIFSRLDAAARLQRVQSMLEPFGSVRMHSFTFSNLEKITEPARLELEYEAPGCQRVEGSTVRATLPAFWEKDYLQTSFIKNRQTPFRFFYPFSFRSQLELALPEAATLAASDLDALNGKAEGAHTRWQMQTTSDGRTLKMVFEFDQLSTSEHPAERYQQWQAEWQAARNAWDNTVSWQR